MEILKLLKQSRLNMRSIFAFIVHYGLVSSNNAFSRQESTLTPRLKEAVAGGLLVQPKPNLYILGTVHIGSESAFEAEELIAVVRPDTVIVEVAPSRLQVLQQQAAARNDSRRKANKEEKRPAEEKRTKTDPISAIFSWPAFAERGWSAGGFMGFVFASAVLWPSFVKRSFTVNEEETELPRRDEFAAAIQAAIAIKTAIIVAADSELDELILDCAQAMSIGDWIQFGYRDAIETTLGLRPKDPIRRQTGESLQEWATRRRTIDTARASKAHGEEVSSSFSRVVVDRRDSRFANACLEALEADPQQTIVCVVGLVHVDGICASL